MFKKGSILLVILLLSLGVKGQGKIFEFDLAPENFERSDFPMSFSLSDIDISDKGVGEMYELNGRKRIKINSQYSSEREELSWIVEGVTEAGKGRKYQLILDGKRSKGKDLKAEKNDSTLVISKEGQEILHYRYKELPAPEDASHLFSRSGFIHPLYSPSGECLTWAQPPDHIHHVGLWNPWTKVTWKGNHTDFWNLGSGLGTVRFRDLISIESGPVYAEFRVLMDHIAFIPAKSKNVEKWDGQEVVVMEEEWRIRVWNIDDGYYLDFNSEFRNILDESISLDKYRYGGGIGYRATSEWNKPRMTPAAWDRTR